MFAAAVIERELRVRARWKETHWVRGSVAAFTTLLCANILGWMSTPAETGVYLFSALIAITFVLCLVEGVRQTSDCLSQERHDGTMGLLFLTRLSAFEIVFGKLVASSIASAGALIAAFPAIGIVFLLGGVTFGEFWRCIAVLLDTMFMASCCGIYASARQTEPNRALLSGLCWMLVITLVPLVALALPISLPTLSPGLALHFASHAQYISEPRLFWLSLLLIQGLAWGLLWNTSRLASKMLRADFAQIQAHDSPNPSSHSARLLNDRRPDPTRPIDWLAGRLKGQRALIWGAFAVFAVGEAWLPYWYPSATGGALSAFPYFATFWVIAIVPSLLLGMASTGIFREARRNGALEVISSTPVPAEQIVRSHWRVAWSRTRIPFYLLGGAGLVGHGYYLRSTFQNLGDWDLYEYSQFVRSFSELMMMVAMWWVGMYHSLRARTPALAFGKTIFYCFIVPAMAQGLSGVVTTMTFSGPVNLNWWTWLPDFVESLMQFAYVVCLTFWCRRALLTRFQDLLAGV